MKNFWMLFFAIFIGIKIGDALFEHFHPSKQSCPIDLTTPRCENALAINRLHDEHPELFCQKEDKDQ